MEVDILATDRPSLTSDLPPPISDPPPQTSVPPPLTSYTPPPVPGLNTLPSEVVISGSDTNKPLVGGTGTPVRQLLFTLFDYLPASCLQRSVHLVSKRLLAASSNDGYFKSRFRRRYALPGVEFPILKHYRLHLDIPSRVKESEPFIAGMDVTWSDVCLRTEMWESSFGDEDSMKETSFGSPQHYCTVDTLHLTKDGRTLVSGGRDKNLCLWEVATQKPLATQSLAHQGWIWDLKAYFNDELYSAGWDDSINHWVLRDSLILMQKIPVKRAMCLSAEEPWLLLAGLQDGRVCAVDPRISRQGIEGWEHSRAIHRGTVVGIHLMEGRTSLSIGEDRKLYIYDLRNLRVLPKPKKVKLPACPKSIAVYRDLCYVGDTRGNLFIFDVKNNFEQIMCFSVGGKRAVNAVRPTLAGVMAGTSDVGLRLIVPSSPSRLVREIPLGGEVTAIAARKNVIVAGTSCNQNPLKLLTVSEN